MIGRRQLSEKRKDTHTLKLSDYLSFIYFSPTTNGQQGRAVYIDPNLLIPFSEYIDPKTSAGLLIAKAIAGALRADAGGPASGSSVIETNHYYRDFGQDGGHCARIFYRVFQDDGGGTTLGPGVYIDDIKPLNKRGSGDKPGLYKVRHVQGKGDWQPEKKTETSLDEEKFMIGAYQLDGAYNSSQTSAIISKTLSNDKTPYNLYYSPDYVLDKNAVWETPEMRIHHTAGPDELANILINSENEWVSGNYGKYHTQGFGVGAKTLLKALEKVAQQGRSLSNHTFSFHSPNASIALLKIAVERCGAKLSDQWINVNPQSSSLIHQENDAANATVLLRSNQKIDPELASKVLAKQSSRQRLLAKTNTTFFELYTAS